MSVFHTLKSARDDTLCMIIIYKHYYYDYYSKPCRPSDSAVYDQLAINL